jgi:hypothetical protein
VLASLAAIVTARMQEITISGRREVFIADISSE